jgi:glycosyltransferase involved in cell wall biosynthesis
MFAKNNQTESNTRERRVIWVEPSHFQMGKSLHTMADIEVSKQLARKRISTFLIVPRSKKFLSLRIGDSQVQTICMPLKFVRLFSSVMYALALLFYLPICIFTVNPDFVITVADVSIVSFVPMFFLSKLKHTKLILDIRSVPVETFGFVGFLQKFWFSVSLLLAKKLFDGITVITPIMKEELCSQFSINPNNVGVWTSGVSEDLFTSAKYSTESNELRTKLGLSKKFIVFYHGVFTASRGLKESIESMKILKNANSDVVLFLLGGGPALSSLKDFVKAQDLEENVIIHDPVAYTEVPKFIGMSDVCIVPLPDNPFWRSQSPLKLLEYLSMEKVVILTDIPAHRLVVGEHKCGVYISSVTAIEIANSITHLMHNKDKLLEWGKSGRTIISDGYTWEKVAGDLETYLLSIEEKSKFKNLARTEALD